MKIYDLLLFYFVPWLITVTALIYNEYRLYREERVSRKAYVNGVSLLLVGLATFAVLQVLMKILAR